MILSVKRVHRALTSLLSRAYSYPKPIATITAHAILFGELSGYTTHGLRLLYSGNKSLIHLKRKTLQEKWREGLDFSNPDVTSGERKKFKLPEIFSENSAMKEYKKTEK